MFEIKASDEVLFVGLEALQSHAEAVDFLVKVVDQTWHDLFDDHTVVSRELAEPTLAGPLPEDVRSNLDLWMLRAVEAGIFPPSPHDKRGPAQADLEWYLPNLSQVEAGREIENFWDFGPIEAASSLH